MVIIESGIPTVLLSGHYSYGIPTVLFGEFIELELELIFLPFVPDAVFSLVHELERWENAAFALVFLEDSQDFFPLIGMKVGPVHKIINPSVYGVK